MRMLKQGTAAIALVVSLGLIVPGSFGGPVSADITHNPNLNLDDPFPMACDLDGDSNNDTEYVKSHYETTYDFRSTANSFVWHDLNSNTVMTQRERIDVLQVDYVALTAVPPSYPSVFTDYTAEWFDVFFAPDIYLKGKPNGRKTVRCVNIAAPYEYTNSVEEAELDKEGQIAAGVPYSEIDYQLFEVKLSASGKGKAQAASADDGQHKAKKDGKHRHNGKRRK